MFAGKSPCTQVGSVADLEGGLKLIDADTLDWKQFGGNLGLSTGLLNNLSLEGVREDESSERVDAVLR